MKIDSIKLILSLRRYKKLPKLVRTLSGVILQFFLELTKVIGLLSSTMQAVKPPRLVYKLGVLKNFVHWEQILTRGIEAF